MHKTLGDGGIIAQSLGGLLQEMRVEPNGVVERAKHAGEKDTGCLCVIAIEDRNKAGMAEASGDIVDR